MKFKDRDALVDKLRELADFIERNGHKLPNFYFTTTAYISLTETDYARNPETGEYESTLNEEGTKKNLKRALYALGTCEKSYKDARLELVKYHKDGVTAMIRATADRSIACKRVVVGQKMQQASYVPAKMVDEVEWQCDEGLSLLSLVKDL